MKNYFLQRTNKDRLVIIASSLIIVSTMIYNISQFYLLKMENISLKNQNSELESTLNYEQSKVRIYQRNLSKTVGENQSIKSQLQVEQANNDFFQGQIQNISSTVGVLEKLSKTDPELLKKYSKVYFLSENYIPAKLTDIPLNYSYQKDKHLS